MPSIWTQTLWSTQSTTFPGMGRPRVQYCHQATPSCTHGQNHGAPSSAFTAAHGRV
nr:MAG TPA: hypothetical protein [Caudoviricetes sp.]